MGKEKHIKELIEASNLDYSLKDALKKTLLALAEYQEDSTRILADKIEVERDAKTEVLKKAPVLVSGLIPEDKLAQAKFYGFNKLWSTPPSHSPVYFLKTPYENFARLCEKSFKGKSASGLAFDYKFSPFFGHVEAEKKLSVFSRLYGLNPLSACSPWARRAVTITRVDGGGLEEDADLCLKENCLQDIVLEKRELIWNIEAQEGALSSKYASPRPFGQVWNYHYPAYDGDKSLWSLPLAVESGKIPPEEISFSKKDGEYIFSSQREFPEEACLKLSFADPASFDGIEDTFNNALSRAQVNFTPRSKADFNRYLSGFSNGEYSCILSERPGDIVVRYWRGHKVLPVFDRVALKGPRGGLVDVEFSGPELFLTDYANLCLEGLENDFPFFAWRGVKCGFGK